MARDRNTDVNGRPFEQTIVGAVWEKGRVLGGHDPKVWRVDRCGALMKKTDYGMTNSQYGWEVDHIMPVSRGGKDDISNLGPLQWENNRKKSDAYPWNCA